VQDDGYETVIHYGVSGAQDIHLLEYNFRFDCHGTSPIRKQPNWAACAK
jgi:hypothetical protein